MPLKCICSLRVRVSLAQNVIIFPWQQMFYYVSKVYILVFSLTIVNFFYTGTFPMGIVFGVKDNC